MATGLGRVSDVFITEPSLVLEKIILLENLPELLMKTLQGLGFPFKNFKFGNIDRVHAADADSVQGRKSILP